MKRLAILMAVLVVIPIAAMARMNSLSDNAMGVVTGQVGIVLDWETQLEDSYIAIYDSDGFGTAKYQNHGAMTLSSFIITGTTAGSNMVITGLSINSGSAGTVGYLEIGLPRIFGLVQAGAFKIGTVDNKGGDIGRWTVGDISIAPTDMRIYTE